ncbi:MAG: hypothetical protein Kow0074_12600 [Candidatus Zixiibacteriota bacterium]
MDRDVRASNSPTIGEIDVSTLHDILADNPGATVIDVRSLPEWMEARVPQVTRFVDFERFAVEIQSQGLNQDDTIYLICRTGNRSDHAARYLASRGFKSVFNVLGGIVDWYQKGFPIASGPLPDTNDGGPQSAE